MLISADALWENGFGVVFPEIDGEPGFDDVGAVFDLIETTAGAAVVIPGHGAPFTDLAARCSGALAPGGFRAEPARRHARHAAKVMLKYHLMEERAQGAQALREWMAETPLLQTIWSRTGPAHGSPGRLV